METKREIDILVNQLNYIPDDRLAEYLEGKNQVRPETADYESSKEAEEAYKRGRAMVSQNSKRSADRKAEGKQR